MLKIVGYNGSVIRNTMPGEGIKPTVCPVQIGTVSDWACASILYEHADTG